MEKLSNRITENWPESYYDLLSRPDRKRYLDEVLRENPDSKDDQERLRLYGFRYVLWENRIIDNFVDAWMTLRLFQNPNFLFRNEKKAPMEIREQAEKLGLLNYEQDEFLKKEWENFAKVYFTTCLEGRTYKSKFLTFFPLSPDKLALKIAEDIDMGTTVIPRVAGLEEAFKPLREVLLDKYSEMIDPENKYWQQYLESK